MSALINRRARLSKASVALAASPAPAQPRTLFETSLAEHGISVLRGVIGGPFNYQVHRQAFVRAYGWGALSGAMVEALRPYAPFLEVGAGGGYWAYELRRAGVRVLPTDPSPTGRAAASAKPWLPVTRLSAVQAVRALPGRTLLSVWPEAAPYAGNALRAHRLQGGQVFAYMGTSFDGCTGGDNLFEELGDHWHLERDVPSLSWWSVGDRLRIYRVGRAP
jgi:hypothetical protein